MLLKPQLFGGVVVQSQILVPETQNSGFGWLVQGSGLGLNVKNWGLDFEILRFRVQCPN